MKKQNKRSTNLSIIIPAYNEEALIGEVIQETLKDISTNSEIKKSEIIVVVDGSTDNTESIARKFVEKHKNVRVVVNNANLGIGGALKSGIRSARFSLITFIPADGQLFLRDISTSVRKIMKADVVLTYRTNRDDYTFYRHFLSFGLRVCMYIFFGLKFRDYNWAHIWRKNIFKRIQPKSNGVFFLAEVAVRGNRAGYKIIESASVYRPRLSGVSRNGRFSMAVGTFLDMLRTWHEMRNI